ncbi:hypothetical protein YC2023_057215 [Brassica napus]
MKELISQNIKTAYIKHKGSSFRSSNAVTRRVVKKTFHYRPRSRSFQCYKSQTMGETDFGWDDEVGLQRAICLV